MSSSATRRSYTLQPAKSSSPSQAIEDSKKKSSLLKDGSWIRRDAEEDEPVDRDPNFGKSVLSGYRSSESPKSTEPQTTKSPKMSRRSTSVQELTKRFSTSQDELNKSSTLPSSQKTPSPFTRRSTSETAAKEELKSSTTTTTTITKDGTTTETNTVTRSVSRSPVIKNPTKTDSFTERVFSDVKSSSKGTLYSPLSPPKAAKVFGTTVTSNKEAKEQPQDKLIPKSKDDFSVTDGSSGAPETVTVEVKSSTDGDGIKTTTTTRASSSSYTPMPVAGHQHAPTAKSPTTVNTKSVLHHKDEDDVHDLPPPFQSKGPKVLSPVSSSVRVPGRHISSSSSGDDRKTTTTRTSSTAEDDLYDTLLPKSLRSDLSSPTRGRPEPVPGPAGTGLTRDDYTSTRRSISRRPNSSYDEYTSVTSPTVSSTPTTLYKESRTDDLLADDLLSESSKTVYRTPERMVLEKDLCTHCRKPFNSDAKMVLEDMQINCHASCFKCEVCSTNLGSLKAGDSMWVYRRAVHCEGCFDTAREKWRR